jgi:hypothetical protein
MTLRTLYVLVHMLNHAASACAHIGQRKAGIYGRVLYMLLFYFRIATRQADLIGLALLLISSLDLSL